MKLLLFLLTFLIIHQNNACERFNQEALENLDAHYKFVKSYPISRSKRFVQFTAVFEKNSFYQITLAEKKLTAEPQLKVTVLDSKKQVIITNEIDGKFLQKISFQMKATGIYYLQYELTKDSSACGAGILGFYNFKFKPNQQYEIVVEITDEQQYKRKQHLSGTTNANSQLRLLLRYRKEKWYEVVNLKNKSDQELARYLSRQVQKSHPKLKFKVKKIHTSP